MAPRIAPSLLSADFANLQSDIERVERGGAEVLHVDVMDGHFVPNLTIGPLVVAAIKRVASVPLDVHLMITEPERYADEFISAGASNLTFHVEAAADPRALAARIRARGATVGLALSPPTPFSSVEPYLDDIDLLLVMSVNPGFGGQSFIEESLEKVRRARAICPRRADGTGLTIEIDGGINRETIVKAAAAGVDLFVAGSAIFKAADVPGEIGILRRLADKAGSGATGVKV